MRKELLNMTANQESYELAGERHNNLGQGKQNPNVGTIERWASLILGGGLLLFGLGRKRIPAALAGGALLYRGATGYCGLYSVLGIDTSEEKRSSVSVPHGQGVKVERSIVVNRSPEELYQFWRNPENLPQFMSHIASVQALGPNRSRWTMKAVVGRSFDWEAEIVNDKPNELIAWRTLEGADVDHAGSVHFERLTADRGTNVRVIMEYRPPAGQIGVAVAKILGEEPDQILDTDLRRFKQLLEGGEVGSARGEAHGIAQH
jgi:uncharacterized membrane protein